MKVLKLRRNWPPVIFASIPPPAAGALLLESIASADFDYLTELTSILWPHQDHF
jgi:hypothetical protein